MVTVTVESIIQANPDVIIIGSSGNKAQAAIEKIKADPAWQSISAVKIIVFMPIQPARSHGTATVPKKPYKFFGQLNSSTQSNLKT